jgi:hypothetical protein
MILRFFPQWTPLQAKHKIQAKEEDKGKNQMNC